MKTFDEFFMEEKLDAEDREKIKEEDWGIIIKDKDGNIIEKAYPMPDAQHVISAARMYPFAKRKYDPKVVAELRRKIIAKAKEYNVPDSRIQSVIDDTPGGKSKPVKESVGPEDDTSGTSEFDESVDNDPDDCYTESDIFITEADKRFLSELKKKNDQLSKFELNRYGKTLIKNSSSGNLIIMLPPQPEKPSDKHVWEYFMMLIEPLRKYRNAIRYGSFNAIKWYKYDKCIRKFFNAIGLPYKDDRILCNIKVSPKGTKLLFKRHEYKTYHFNPSTYVLIHQSPKNNLTLLRPTHCSKDGVIYPKPRVYAVMRKLSNTSAFGYGISGGDFGDNFYVLDCKPMEVYHDMEYGAPTKESGDNTAVFINTTKPIKVIPLEQFMKTEHTSEAFDAVTGEEIPIDHAYTMDEMKEITLSITESERPKFPDEFNRISNDIISPIGKYVKEKSQPPTGNQNCQLCVWSMEARFRDIPDALPRPVYSPRDPVLNIPGEVIVYDPKKIHVKSYTDVASEVTKAGDGCRFYVHVNWKDSQGGHEFVLLRIDGKNYMADPQCSMLAEMTKHLKYFTDVNYANSYMCRLDDKKFNKPLFDKWNDVSTVLPWDPKKDIPYMLKEGMITKEEADKELRKSSTERFTSELKRELKNHPVQESTLPKGITLRPAEEKDLPNIIQWKLESINQDLVDNPKVIRFIKNDARENLNNTRMILCDDDTIGVLESCYIDDGEWWYIGEIYLIPEYRGKGIAKALLQDEIVSHDKLKLKVSKDNDHAIELYKSLGFIISESDEYSYVMTLVKDSVQEGVIQNIKNKTSPFEKNLVYHISPEGHLDGQIFKPRVPDYLDKYDPSKTEFEDVETPRVCFSPSIEGCLNAIIVNIGRWKTANKLRDWYVYIPEKPLKEYKYRTNKQLVDEKKVYDANITKEIWIEEPVRLKQYGIIRIDSVTDKSRKKAVPTTLGESKKRNVYDFKWHWLVKPKVLKDVPYDYSPLEVCKDMIADLERYKYGIPENGKIVKGSSKDYDTKWKLQSPEEFEKNGGGICFDYVEFEEGYLDAYGIKCKKYYMSTNLPDGDCHTFIIVDDGKGGLVYPESSFDAMAGTHQAKSKEEIFKMVANGFWKMNDNVNKVNEIKYYVWEYNGHPKYGSNIKQCMEYYSKGEPIFEAYTLKPGKSQPIREFVTHFRNT